MQKLRHSKKPKTKRYNYGSDRCKSAGILCFAPPVFTTKVRTGCYKCGEKASRESESEGAPVRLRIVTDHYAVTGGGDSNCGALPPKRGPVEFREFWATCGLAEADHAVIAVDARRLVGVFRFSVRRDILWAAGTWVASAHRRQGLATRMWEMARDRFAVKLVDVVTATDAGAHFVDSMPWVREAENALIVKRREEREERAERFDELYEELRRANNKA